MKIKRFFAPDMRQAMRLVREELGPDAVILSNKRVKGGVEIVSAMDYDEELLMPADPLNEDALSAIPTPAIDHDPSPRMTIPRDESVANKPRKPPEIAWSQEPALLEMRRELHMLRSLMEQQLTGLAWGEIMRDFPHQVALFKRLMKLGLGATLARQFIEDLPSALAESGDTEGQWRRALGILAHKIPVGEEDVLNAGGIAAFVGPTGVGKTTTIAKLAARYALRHGAKHVALITTDNYRIGALDQLKTYGRLLDVPVRVASDSEELKKVLLDLKDRRLILIDTAGMSQRDLRLATQFSVLNSGRNIIRPYLVLSATTRLSGLEEAARAFQGIGLAGTILTKLDETTSLGSALSVIIQNTLPVLYVTDGQRVPEDLHNARAHTLVSRAVAIMQHSAQSLEDELFISAPRRESKPHVRS